jgi:uncharacterized DUF497 family protein
VRIVWDEAKNLANQRKHGVSFEEASKLFTSRVGYLEVFDEAHSDVEDRFIAIGPISRGSSLSSGLIEKRELSGSSALVGPRGVSKDSIGST